MKEVSASIMVLAGAVLTCQKVAEFLVLAGMGLMAIGFLSWVALMVRPSPPK